MLGVFRIQCTNNIKNASFICLCIISTYDILHSKYVVPVSILTPFCLDLYSFVHLTQTPIPVPIMTELKKYVFGFDPEQEQIFNRHFNQRRWNKIREKLGLSNFKFHDLRKTFGSVLAQNGISTDVTQKPLEHSSPDLTNKVYTNVDPVLRHAVDKKTIC